MLIPFVQITSRPVRRPARQDAAESPFGGTGIADLRLAHDTGRLRDLAAIPYQPRLSFEPSKWTWPTTSPWTGLLYSPYQFLAMPELDAPLGGDPRGQFADALRTTALPRKVAGHRAESYFEPDRISRPSASN
jgi:hypothetical protein